MPRLVERAKTRSVRGQKPPERRSIPLPPDSLRPPPRRRPPKPEPPVAEPTLPPGTRRDPRASGARRGFFLGFLLPALGVAVAAGLWWVTRPEPAPTPETSVGVRTSRDASPSRTAVPAPAEGLREAPAGGDDAAAAGGPGRALAAGAAEVTIQIASFRTRRRAEAVLSAAEERTGLRGIMVSAQVDGVRWYRILLGAFGTEREAVAAAAPLLREGMITEVLAVPVRDGWRPGLTGNEEGSR